MSRRRSALPSSLFSRHQEVASNTGRSPTASIPEFRPSSDRSHGSTPKAEEVLRQSSTGPSRTPVQSAPPWRQVRAIPIQTTGGSRSEASILSEVSYQSSRREQPPSGGSLLDRYYASCKTIEAQSVQEGESSILQDDIEPSASRFSDYNVHLDRDDGPREILAIVARPGDNRSLAGSAESEDEEHPQLPHSAKRFVELPTVVLPADDETAHSTDQARSVCSLTPRATSVASTGRDLPPHLASASTSYRKPHFARSTTRSDRAGNSAPSAPRPHVTSSNTTPLGPRRSGSVLRWRVVV